MYLFTISPYLVRLIYQEDTLRENSAVLLEAILQDWKEIEGRSGGVVRGGSTSPFKSHQRESPVRRQTSTRLSSLFDYEETKANEEEKSIQEETYVKNEETSFFF